MNSFSIHQVESIHDLYGDFIFNQPSECYAFFVIQNPIMYTMTIYPLIENNIQPLVLYQMSTIMLL